ncbi:MAG: restriction endonuclease subunit S [Proteobacteria bacterium]|nr:restriction endonuclease subunit S [Pseudomonadota bacterium]
MALKLGYQQTEVGMIPEDWEVMSVEDIAEVRSGKRLPLGNSLTDKVTAYPYIRVADMETGTVNLDEIKYVPEQVYPSIKNYRIFLDDIFISVAGTLGIVGKIPPQLNGANLTENADRLTNISCDRDYLMYLLMSPLIQNTIESERTLGAQPKLALTRIRKFKIPLPPSKVEQTAIANALGDADALIQSITSLIAKKRQIKQGAMQTLLNPYENGRLKAGWVVKKLGDVAILKARIGWQGLTTAEYRKTGDYFLITGTEFRNGYIDWGSCFYVDLSRYKQDRNIQIKENDVLVTKDGTIGKVAFIKRISKPATLNSGVFVIRPIDGSFYPEFFYYVLLSDIFDRFLSQLSAGSTISHLYQKDFINFEFYTPEDNNEQTRIATILSGMDAEIAALETKLAKYRHIKQGMMQNLLTGRIRLVQPDSNTGAAA